jgi:glycosyltransferase involved in cell wall biosynthesis
VFPSPDGPGLAMRPYYQIVNLSRIYSIHLLVAGTIPERPVYGGDIKKYCENIDYICRYRFSGWKLSLWHRSCRLMDKLRHFVRGDDLSFVADMADIGYLQHNKTLAKIASMKFDMVHVFRLYLTPVAEILKKQELNFNSFYSLDIDDIESETRRSISELYFRNRDFIQALRLNNESIIFFNMETKSFPTYDQIFTCSRRDRNILQNRFPGKVISVLPNVVPIPKKARNHRANQIFTMLFVGTMGYHPNADALLFFADQIAPILRENSPRQWHLRVVGTIPENTWVKKLECFPEIKFAGWVKNLSHKYDAADIVVAPIRGGGGTRIKILEAFAHGVPVVSTSKGAEGLDVENGVHIFIEDDPRLFAEACIRLMTDQLIGDEISRRALDLASSEYSPEIINSAWTGQLPSTCRS